MTCCRSSLARLAVSMVFLATLTATVRGGDDSKAEYRDGQRRYNTQVQMYEPDLGAPIPTEESTRPKTGEPASLFPNAPSSPEGYAPNLSGPPPARKMNQKPKAKNWIVPRDFEAVSAEPTDEQPETQPGEPPADKPRPSGWGWLADESQKAANQNLADSVEDPDSGLPDEQHPEGRDLNRSEKNAKESVRPGEFKPVIDDAPVRRSDPSGRFADDLDTAGTQPDPGDQRPENISDRDSPWSFNSDDKWERNSVWDRDQDMDTSLPQTESLLSQITESIRPASSPLPGLSELLPKQVSDSEARSADLGKSVLNPSVGAPDAGAADQNSAPGPSPSISPSWDTSRNFGLPDVNTAPGAGSSVRALESMKPTESFKPLTDFPADSR